MGKVKLLLDVIGDLRSLADSLQAVADAVADNGAAEAELTTTKEPEETGKVGKTGKAAAKNTAKKEAKAAKQEPEEKPLTLEEVRAVLAEKSRSGHTDEVRELLAKHGADKLSEIDPAEYPALLAEAEVL
ncbi:rRNA biogenesis protein rrp5 [Candidatus Merdisoma sp. JLR.KK011]|uniref:rRNA biogenesis protein rrp5 n=1 Tax=Candidatus Merdisoma sp. JLR.KK011 TaxID=3114299 RepID=UPI002FF39443